MFANKIWEENVRRGVGSDKRRHRNCSRVFHQFFFQTSLFYQTLSSLTFSYPTPLPNLIENTPSPKQKHKSVETTGLSTSKHRPPSIWKFREVVQGSFLGGGRGRSRCRLPRSFPLPASPGRQLPVQKELKYPGALFSISPTV